VQQLCKSCRTCFMIYCMFYFTFNDVRLSTPEECLNVPATTSLLLLQLSWESDHNASPSVRLKSIITRFTLIVLSAIRLNCESLQGMQYKQQCTVSLPVEGLYIITVGQFQRLQWRRYVVAKQCKCTASLLPCDAMRCTVSVTVTLL